MPLTLTDVAEKLKGLDEIIVMEILEISSEDLVNNFMDRVEDKFEKLAEEFDEE